jgi:hypothetical protein
MTHPDHKEKHARKKMTPNLALAILALIALFLALFSLRAHAQESGLDRITFQNSSGTALRSFVSPFNFKCSTNMTCSITGNTVTVSAAGGGAGGGYSTIQNGGAAIAAEAAINFLGSFSCVDNPGNTSSDCKLTASAAVAHQFVTGVDSSGNYLRAAILAADVPTLNQSTTGNAGTATALAANPTDCSAGQYANAIDASGNLTCAQVGYSQIGSTPLLAVTKTCTGTDKVSAYDSTTGLFTCTTDQTGAGGSTPTGTGFTHITAGVQDTAAKTVDVSSTDITGTLKAAAEPAHTGDVTNSPGSLALAISAGAVTRADLASDAVGWQFLGKATWVSGATIGPITLTAARKHIECRGWILGYAAAGIASWQYGGATIDTGAHYAAGILEGATLNTSSINVTGIRSAVTTTTGPRSLLMEVDTWATNQVKRPRIWSDSISVSAGTAPTMATTAGIWVDTTNSIQTIQITAFNALTGTTTVNFTGGEAECWGRDDN